MTLHVLAPGLHSLVVDFGRPHCRSLGVPVGGAADRTALALGNALVGNAADAAALEISMAGPTLQADCDLACVVYGAPFELFSERQKLTVGKTFTLSAGEQLSIGGTHEGMRAYLCVRGGLQEKVVLGSRSALEPLTAGAELRCESSSIHRRWMPTDWIWEPFGLESSLKPLRVLQGPQAEWFPTEPFFGGLDSSAAPVFRVTPQSNRMGIRLLGEPLSVPARELVSEPVCPGAVQVTRDGQCIILGVDGQTIGGYPKIAQVIAADLDLLGQLRPGDQVCFVPVQLAQAEILYRRKEAELRAWVTRLRVALGAW